MGCCSPRAPRAARRPPPRAPGPWPRSSGNRWGKPRSGASRPIFLTASPRPLRPLPLALRPGLAEHVGGGPGRLVAPLARRRRRRGRLELRAVRPLRRLRRSRSLALRASMPLGPLSGDSDGIANRVQKSPATLRERSTSHIQFEKELLNSSLNSSLFADANNECNSYLGYTLISYFSAYLIILNGERSGLLYSSCISNSRPKEHSCSTRNHSRSLRLY